jgi:hypothetical protein
VSPIAGAHERVTMHPAGFQRRRKLPDMSNRVAILFLAVLILVLSPVISVHLTEPGAA